MCRDIVNEDVFGMLLFVTKHTHGPALQFLGSFMGDVVRSPDGTKLYGHVSYVGMQALEEWKCVTFGVFENISYFLVMPRKKQSNDTKNPIGTFSKEVCP